VEPVDSCCVKAYVTGPTFVGRRPFTFWPTASVAAFGVGVGGSAGAVSVTRSVCDVLSPLAANAVRTTSPVAFTLKVFEPEGGRSPPAPEIDTRTAPVVVQVAVTGRGAQPVVGERP
jgi:hypothetical protein